MIPDFSAAISSTDAADQAERLSKAFISEIESKLL
jgi:hypothetical protein